MQLRRVIFLMLAFLSLHAHASEPFNFAEAYSPRVPGVTASSIRIESGSMVGDVVPGGGGAWFLFYAVSGTRFIVDGLLTPDSDNDGQVRITMPSVWSGVVVLVDMTDGTIAPWSPSSLAFPRALFLPDQDGHYTYVMHDLNYLSDYAVYMWVRPGVGAWTHQATEGGQKTDLDKTTNGIIVFTTSMMTAVDDSPAPPSNGLRPGDVFLAAIPSPSFGLPIKWFGDRVNTHLSEGDGPGLVRFSVPYTTVDDTAGAVHLQVLRKNGARGPVSVRYATSDDTAVAGIHYTATAGTLEFAPGEILRTIDIPIIDNGTFAFTPRFNVTLSSPVDAGLASPSAMSVTINDKDPLPVLSLSGGGHTILEGDEGVKEIPFVAGIAGNDGFFAAQWSAWCDGRPFKLGQFTFAPTEKFHTIMVPIQGNRIQERDHQCSLEITDSYGYRLFALASFVVTDDDIPEVSALDGSVSEGETGVNVILEIDPLPILQPVTITYATEDGTAKAGQDYVAFQGSRIMRSSILIPITLLNDDRLEGNETFSLNLTGVANGQIVRQRATITIVDDETAPLPQLSVGAANAVESRDGVLLFNLRLSSPAPAEARVRVSTIPGAAKPGADYISRDEIVTFPRDTQRQQFAVALLDDDIPERNESLTLALSEPLGLTLATPTATGTILDDDEEPVFLSDDVEIAEGTAASNNVARFTFRLSRPISNPRTAHYETTNASATAPSDYLPVAGSLLFMPGETSKTVDVPIVPDSRVEPDETFLLVVDGAPLATCHILNDDVEVARRRSVRH